MTEPTRPSGEWQPSDTDRLSVPVAYLTVGRDSVIWPHRDGGGWPHFATRRAVVTELFGPTR
jgi:hypothetical protein